MNEPGPAYGEDVSVVSLRHVRQTKDDKLLAVAVLQMTRRERTAEEAERDRGYGAGTVRPSYWDTRVVSTGGVVSYGATDVVPDDTVSARLSVSDGSVGIGKGTVVFKPGQTVATALIDISQGLKQLVDAARDGEARLNREFTHLGEFAPVPYDGNYSIAVDIELSHARGNKRAAFADDSLRPAPLSDETVKEARKVLADHGLAGYQEGPPVIGISIDEQFEHSVLPYEHETYGIGELSEPATLGRQKYPSDGSGCHRSLTWTYRV
ncbi:hypothetical protein OHV05_38075 (plasmid) [Kitasatospora sp. NBC_00070]|uniref:hypothetical protein n=1 Tax=Kitasatospora sp. NBC_00070 TaxID=2975962 RepID=UPI002F910FFC